jgi:hypothetical protein
MATWPSTLPAPLLAGNQLSPVAPSMRTDMEFGAARSRRQTKARDDHVGAAWNMSDAQMAIFRAWFDSDSEAAGGSAWFAITLRIGNTGATAQEARFIGIYQATQVGLYRWQVSAQLEVR